MRIFSTFSTTVTKQKAEAEEMDVCESPCVCMKENMGKDNEQKNKFLHSYLHLYKLQWIIRVLIKSDTRVIIYPMLLRFGTILKG